MKFSAWKDTYSRNSVHLGAGLGVLLFSFSLFAQANFGRILGTITDQTGAVLPGVVVLVIDTERGIARNLVTDAAGEYDAPNLTPSTYSVRVQAKGFKTLDRPNIELGVGKEIRVDLTPQPGEQSQTVTVEAAAPLVDATSATLGGTLNNADINDLPLNGRNFQSLMGLRPGVMLQPGGSPWTQSTNNVRPDETSWMVDGILNANAFDARPVAGASSPFTDGATILPIDAIQEFNLMENPKAEYGGKPGAVVNVGIRSGTNSYHGSVYAFGRDNAWSARNLFNPPPNDVQPLSLEQFGGVVGGPIKKDKLFFFGGYEGLRSFIGNPIGTAVPYTGPGSPRDSMVGAILSLQGAGITPSPLSLKLLGCTAGAAPTCTGGYIQNAPSSSTSYVSTLPISNTSDNGIGKIDYHINSKHTINGMLYKSSYASTGADFPMVNAAWGNTVLEPAWTTSGNWIWTASSDLVNDFRVGYNRFGFFFLPSDAGILADGKGYPINTGITSTGGFPSIVIYGFGQTQLGSRRGRPLEASPNPFYNFQDNISYLRGKHALKFGFDFSHIEGDSNPHDTRGRIDFQGKQIAAIPDPSASGGVRPSYPLEDFFAGLPSRGQQLVGTPAVQITIKQYAGFVQDDWRIVPKIMLNLGLRYSYATPFHEANNLLGNFDPALGLVQQGQASVGDYLWHPDHKNFSPRVGFAWDITGKGTTILRAGSGIFYSLLSVAPFTGNPGIGNVGGTSIATVPTGACTTTVAVGSPCPQTYGGTIATGTALIAGAVRPPGTPGLNWNGVVFPSGAVFSCTPSARCSIGSVDPNLRTPYVGNWNIGIQHAFTSNLSLEVGYVGTHGDNLIGNVDLNQPTSLAPGSVTPYGAKYPFLQFINHVENYAYSNYNSLQTTLTKRLSHGFNFTVGYTYGHGLDNGSLNRFAGQPQNSLNPAAEYASSDFDIRHRATFTASYEIPGPKGYGQLLHGWKLNTIVTLSGSQPWNIIDGSDNFSAVNDGHPENTDRWDFFGNPSDFTATSGSLPYCTGPGHHDCSVTSGVSGIQSFFSDSQTAAMWAQCVAVAPDINTLDPNSKLGGAGCYVKGKSVLVPNAEGAYGTMGRNIFRDAGFKNVDFSVFKTFTYKEKINATFRAEFFNFFNHPIIANPFGSVNGYGGGSDPSSGTTFGCGCTTPDVAAGNPIVGSGSSRQIQLGLKLTF
jgi:Carboxypeptidase regulatory-like domain/TonB dependent receptor